MHRARSRRQRRRNLTGLEQTDLVQQDARSLSFVLELPLAGFEFCILEFVRSTGVEDGAVAEHAVYKPAFFELEHFSGKRLSFEFVDGHGAEYMAGSLPFHRFSANLSPWDARQVSVVSSS